MKQADSKKFRDIMKGLQMAIVPDKSIHKETVEIYFRAFQGWTIEQFERACLKVLDTKKISTFPLIGEIKEALNDPTEALNAWLMAREAVSKHGACMSVKFPNPVIHSVIEIMGGWISFCHVPEEEQKWKLKDFERFYDLLKYKQKHPEYAVGIYEINNIANGYKRVETIIQIGDTPLQVE